MKILQIISAAADASAEYKSAVQNSRANVVAYALVETCNGVQRILPVINWNTESGAVDLLDTMSGEVLLLGDGG